jgi:hypothetical protein
MSDINANYLRALSMALSCRKKPMKVWAWLNSKHLFEKNTFLIINNHQRKAKCNLTKGNIYLICLYVIRESSHLKGQLGTVVHTCNPGTWEAGAGGSWAVY